MRVHVVDPSAYTPPYDAALCAALARQGAEVELVTSEFAYGERPKPCGYAVREDFYRHAVGRPASALRLASKLAEHVPDMLSYRRRAQAADVVHFQWLAIQWLDRYLLPRRPLVLTAHDLLPREPRRGQLAGQRRLYDAVDAVIVHSEFGRSQLVGRLGISAEKVRVIHHGAFSHLAELPDAELPPELPERQGPVVLFFGLLRPYKGVSVLLEAWRSLSSRDGAADAELWLIGRPRMSMAPLRAAADPRVRFVPRFVSDAELAACFRRADVVVLPYVEAERIDFSGVLATALAFAKPLVVSDVGGFGELAGTGAVRLVPPADTDALASALGELLSDRGARKRMELAAAAAVAGPYSWQQSARRTLMVYRQIAR
jgi:glycosyltransferase involved in cell wall biosynthesis